MISISICYSYSTFNLTIIGPLCLSLSFCLLRYIFYFGGLLSGAIKMNSSPLFLHQVLIPSLPNFQGEGGETASKEYSFIRVYVMNEQGGNEPEHLTQQDMASLEGRPERKLCLIIPKNILLPPPPSFPTF